MSQERGNGTTQPITDLNGNIELHFSLSEEELAGLDPSTLVVYKQSEDGSVTEYPGTYNWSEGTVSIAASHLCRFFLMGREGIPTERLSGNNRYATAAAISAKGWTTSENVILVSGENFPDALAATALAGLKKAPVLLTAKDALNSETLAEIKRLKAKTIWLIGGTGVISQAVEDQLKKDCTVRRIAGSSRYETAVKIGEQVRTDSADNSADSNSASIGFGDTAILCTGLNYPDALSIAPFAGKLIYPILFTGKDELNAQSQKALSDWRIKNVCLLGGSGVISEAVERTLKEMGIQATRLAGEDRYATSLAVAKYFAGPAAPYSQAALATGLNFPDALAGAALAAKGGYPVLLASPNAPAAQVRNYLQTLAPQKIYLCGGEQALPDKLRYDISLKAAAGL